MEVSTQSQMSARRRLAALVRQLASGRITNDQFEDAALGGEPDDACREIYSFAWSFYDDLYEHRLRGRHRLSPYQRQVFARCVLFLRSDRPYEWPPEAKWMWCPQRAKRPLANRLAALFRNLTSREERDRELKRGRVDDRIWPFRTRADLNAALARPLYFAGPTN